MRVTVDRRDKGYNLYKSTANIRVFLNGVEQKLCITADNEENYVIRYATDRNGKILTNDSCQHATTETVYGDVKIIDSDDEGEQ